MWRATTIGIEIIATCAVAAGVVRLVKADALNAPFWGYGNGGTEESVRYMSGKLGQDVLFIQSYTGLYEAFS